MANTRTVGASGKDHTTIGSALSWFQSNHNFGTDGIGTISVEDNAEYNENITISGISGTPSSTAYLKLTVASANRHAGVAGTGHARMRGSTNGSHVITVSTDYTVIEYLEIQQDSTGSSDEGIRVTSGTDDVLVSRCIVWSDQNTNDQDGIYMGNWGGSVSVDNCILYGWHRAGLHAQNYSGSGTQTWNVDHCTVFDCGGEDTSDAGGIAVRSVSGAAVNFNVYNTASLNCSGTFSEDWRDKDLTGATISGSHNADTDNSLAGFGASTSSQASLTVSTTSQSSGSYFVVNNTTAGSEDLLLLDDGAGNLAYGNGTDRQGSEPDTRQDFSTDIAGNTRSTSSPSPDIGAHEYTSGGTNYTLTADSGSFTLTGQAATLRAARTLSADNGSYTLTGQTAGLQYGRVLSADSGTYNLSGQTAGLKVGRMLAADSGSLTLTGQAATLTYSGSTYTLAADSASFTLTGQSASLTVQRKLVANSGSFTLTGQAAGLKRDFTLTANGGSYTLTGQTANLLRTYVMPADSGSFTLTGVAADLTYSGASAWTQQTDATTTWTEQSDSTTTWTLQTDSTTNWTLQ